MSLFLGFHAACHQRRLCRMESGNRTAGNGDEHKAPNRLSVRMHIGKVAPNLRNCIIGIGKYAKDNSKCHDNQAYTEERINTPDNLVNGKECCDKVVCKDNPKPYFCVCHNAFHTTVSKQGNNQTRRAYRKYRTYHNKKHYAEYTHNILHCVSEIDAAYFGNGCTFVSFRKHTREVVMHATRENRTKGNPKEYNRSPQCTL